MRLSSRHVPLATTVIVVFTTAGSEFTLGRALAVSRGASVELERIVPLDDGVFPYCRVHGERDPAGFAEALASNPVVVDGSHVTDGADGELFLVECSSDAVDGILERLLESDGQVLAANSRDDQWSFRLRFATSGRLANFQRDTTDAGVDIEIGRVYETTDGSTDPDFGLTAAQVDATVTAVETGSFRVPRSISTDDLGAILGISDQAVSERIRHGVETPARNALDVPDRKP